MAHSRRSTDNDVTSHIPRVRAVLLVLLILQNFRRYAQSDIKRRSPSPSLCVRMLEQIAEGTESHESLKKNDPDPKKGQKYTQCCTVFESWWKM